MCPTIQKTASAIVEYKQDVETPTDPTQILLTTKQCQKILQSPSKAKEHEKNKNDEKYIKIKIHTTDLKYIKKLAEKEGLPYLMLITSVLHKFATGQLIAKASKE